MFKKTAKMPKTQYLCGFAACISKGRAGQTKQKQPIGLFFVLLAVKKRDLNGLGSE